MTRTMTRLEKTIKKGKANTRRNAKAGTQPGERAQSRPVTGVNISTINFPKSTPTFLSLTESVHQYLQINNEISKGL